MVPSNYLQSIPEGHFQQRDSTTLGVCVCPRRTKVSKKHMLILAVLAVIAMVHPVNAQPSVTAKRCTGYGGHIVKQAGHLICKGGRYNNSPVR